MITYPVDITKTYTFKVDGKVNRRAKWPNDWGTPLEVEQVILEESMAPLPVEGVDYDPETQKIGPGEWIDDELNQTATFVRPVVQLTETEIAERVRQQELDALRDQAKSVYLDLKNGVGTAGERATRLEQVVAWLLKREFSDLD